VRPPGDDTTTGSPIGPITRSSLDVGGFDAGGSGATGAEGGSSGSGGMGCIVSNQRERQ